MDPSKISILLGTNDVRQYKQDKLYGVAKVHTHPSFTNQAPFHSDIAILELARPIQFGDGVDKACLNYQDKHYDYLIASGEKLEAYDDIVFRLILSIFSVEPL